MYVYQLSYRTVIYSTYIIHQYTNNNPYIQQGPEQDFVIVTKPTLVPTMFVKFAFLVPHPSSHSVQLNCAIELTLTCQVLVLSLFPVYLLG